MPDDIICNHSIEKNQMTDYFKKNAETLSNRVNLSKVLQEYEERLDKLKRDLIEEGNSHNDGTVLAKKLKESIENLNQSIALEKGRMLNSKNR
ncbi:MAG: hypothetical protein JW974_01430 [Alphaproteobacteria bacterium]|nr:hypothetical protein [Alphaproteobacteria bacterium]MBN2675444.1 hypothetical protein [Alphaproteobacteria bacterium]